MLAISRCGRQAYALSIQGEIKTHGHALTLGVLYTVLNRFERRQLVRHRDGDPTTERRDRPKRSYALTASGAREFGGAMRALAGPRSPALAPQVAWPAR